MKSNTSDEDDVDGNWTNEDQDVMYLGNSHGRKDDAFFPGDNMWIKQSNS